MTLALERGLSPSRAVLPNGAVVLAQFNGTTPAVAVNLTFLAGSLNDPADLSGCAYLTGTTLDRGTERRSAAARGRGGDYRRAVHLGNEV